MIVGFHNTLHNLSLKIKDIFSYYYQNYSVYLIFITYFLGKNIKIPKDIKEPSVEYELLEKSDLKQLNIEIKKSLNYFNIPDFYLEKYLYPNESLNKESLDIKFN